MIKLIRTAAGYAALALVVSVGGVVVGAGVVAPAVARAKPVVQRVFGNEAALPANPAQQSAHSEASGGPVGQADGDGVNAQVVIAEPFKPMAEVIAASSGAMDEASIAPVPTGPAALRARAVSALDAFRIALASVPKLVWLAVDLLLVLAAAAFWFVRRRGSGSTQSGSDLTRRSVAALPVRLVSGRISRTPKAVAALAEAGTAPADIARRTGLPLDAVAMLLSMASFGGRQLQPPTA